MNPLSLLFGGIGAAGQIGYGLYELIHGNKKLNQLERPIYSPDKGIRYNQQLAAQTASQGIPDSARNFYGDAIDRNLGTSINAATSTGQGLGTISNFQSNANDAFRQLMAMDAQQKMQNQQVLMNANRDLRDENLRAFDYNKASPYAEAYNRFTQQTNSGAQNIFGGLNQFGSMLTPFNGLFGGGGGDNGTSQPNLNGGMNGYDYMNGRLRGGYYGGGGM